MNRQARTRLGLKAAVSAFAFAAFAALASTSAQAADLCNNTNGGGVINNPPNATTLCNLGRPAHISQLVTYHWNGGRGARPGSIMLVNSQAGVRYGPFQTHGTSGQNGAPNVNWIADVNINVPAGMYQVIDSDHASWSWNPQSGNAGFAVVRGDFMAAPPSPGPRPSGGGSSGGGSGGGALPLPNPCRANSASYLELAKPVCGGTPGTVLTLYVSRNGLRTRPTVATFARGPLGAMHFANINLPYGPAVLQQPLTLVRGDGLQPGSLYTVQIPAGACFSGRNHMWAFDLNVPGAGAIDYVTVNC